MASPDVQYPTSPYLLPEKLSFDDPGTNYPVWKAHLAYLFRRQGLIGFVDGSNQPLPETMFPASDMRNPNYDTWKTDQALKHGILCLVEDGVVPDGMGEDTETTSRDVWLYLENKFRQHLKRFATGGGTRNGSGKGGSTIIMRQESLLRNWDEYSQLYSAAQEGNWWAAEEILRNAGTNEAKTATALRVAVGAGRTAIEFVYNLVKLMSPESVEAKDALGNTALSIAAAVGNFDAVTILVDKNLNLLNIPNILDEYPIHIAAKHAKRDVLVYLMQVTGEDDECAYEDSRGLALLISTIEADFYDIALSLVKINPVLATLKHSANSALKSIAQMEFVSAEDILLPSKKGLRRFFSRFGMKTSSKYQDDNVSRTQDYLLSVNRERMKRQAVDLVIFLCMEMRYLNVFEAEDIYRDAILIAAKLGSSEIVKLIIGFFPNAIYCSDPDSFQNIFHIAVENRCERVYDFLNQISDDKKRDLDVPDINGNYPLHLAAKMAPPDKLRSLPNAAAKMQHEVLWFTSMKKLAHPRRREQLNYAGESPDMIFKKEHAELRKEGEEWMKSTATSSMVSATLIGTVTFAAAITVPGGNDPSGGLPLFSRNGVFILFAIADSISFLASVTAILTYLYISSARYTEEDFVINLNRRYSTGLTALYISVFFLMITFSAMLCLVFGRMYWWILVLALVVSGVLIQSFGLQQLVNQDSRNSAWQKKYFGKKAKKTKKKKSANAVWRLDEIMV